MAAGGGIDQLGIDPHAAARASGTALQHIFHTQLAGNLTDVDGSTLVGKR